MSTWGNGNPLNVPGPPLLAVTFIYYQNHITTRRSVEDGYFFLKTSPSSTPSRLLITMAQSVATNKYMITAVLLSSMIVGGAAGYDTNPVEQPGLPEPIYLPATNATSSEVGIMEGFPTVQIVPSQYPSNSTYLPPQGDGLTQPPVVVT